MKDDLDPEGRRLPVKIDGTSNGEFLPEPENKIQRAYNCHANEISDHYAKRLNLSRRRFLKSSCGMAAGFLALNQIGKTFVTGGGLFTIPEAAAMDRDMADAIIRGDELIIDMQTHCVDPSADWARGEDGRRWQRVLGQVFGQSAKCDTGSFDCFSAKQLVKEVFLDSDTDITVISALWGARNQNPTPIEYAAEVRDILETLGDRQRVLIQGGVLPNEPGALDFMDEQAEVFKVDAWKLYPQWGPDGVGYFMDDETHGIPLLERARKIGVKVICAHRGIPLGGGLEYKYSDPSDIARAANIFPDLTFLCYHSGFEPGHAEGPYNPDQPEGIDRFIKSAVEQGYTPNKGNLYAEMGSLWRYYMSRPDQAAHVMGKLIKYLGEERICWGTDSIWYGSPQDQIVAFRNFKISEGFREKYGYPEITRSMKEKILGLNAARIHNINAGRLKQIDRDRIRELKTTYSEDPNPGFRTFGPKTRRDFLALANARQGYPA
ncbi:MAG TPA: amidohydrolase family protein [Gammaproteobacteria bacterium]|nr:amidohydrolase family protein [Gammaproteobacteria bacterium]